jgi:nitrate/nitrite-specific signal transduction histidine kinase
MINLQLATEIHTANRQLQDYSAQLENLAVTRERNRFARELHDSVTQTVFSTLTINGVVLLKPDPAQVKAAYAWISLFAVPWLKCKRDLIAQTRWCINPGWCLPSVT